MHPDSCDQLELRLSSVLSNTTNTTSDNQETPATMPRTAISKQRDATYPMQIANSCRKQRRRRQRRQMTSICRVLAVLASLLTMQRLAQAAHQATLYGSGEQLSSAASHSFSCGKLYYRTLHLDQQRNALYVGAMDNIFRLNLANVNKTNCLDDAIRLEPTDAQKCITKGKSGEFDCRNHVKVIQPMGKNGDKLYVCGTNAYNPRDYTVHAHNLTIAEGAASLGVGASAQAECPFDPDDNSTAVWVEQGNPSHAPALYTGTATDFNKADPLIFRTELYNQTSGQKLHDAKRTTKYDSKWLDKPNFVGSFDIGDYVYFFFRESAVEYINCGKSIYSRVARVCKRDNGYKPVMYEKVWTTFLKARLNCSIPGEFPFYFDEIQSVFRNPYDERKFHAVFTTSGNGLSGSAICSFSLDAIQEAFNGKFKEQESSTAAWLPVPSFKLNPNEPRPGTCVDDTLTLSDQVVTFIRNHPLMDSAVANDNGRPVFYRRDVMFARIVVDVVEIDGLRYTVYFAGTNTGHVYKIVEWHTSAAAADWNAQQQQQQQHTQSALVEIIEATPGEPVRALEISARHRSLYVASDSQVRQFSLTQCKQRHETCVSCVRDPYCGWDRKHLECRHLSMIDSNNLIQDVTSETPDLCHTALKHKDVHVTWGQSVHLPCRFNGFVQEAQDLQQLLAAQQRHSAASQQQTMFASAPDYAQQSASLQQSKHTHGQLHGGIVQPPQYIQWFYHQRADLGASAAGGAGLMTPGMPLLQQQRHSAAGDLAQQQQQHQAKFVLAADQGLVIMDAKEPGWYQCRLGNQIIHSYNLIIDTKTCAAPNEAEFKRVYADWCREVERYKSAYRNWHAKQNRCQAIDASQQQQQQHSQFNSGQQPLAAYTRQQQQQQQQQHNSDMWRG